MILYLYHSLASNGNTLFFEYDTCITNRVKTIDVKPFFEIVGTDELYKINQEEYFLNKISQSLSKDLIEKTKLIVIDSNLGGDGVSRCVNLVYHIALSIKKELSYIIAEKSEVNLAKYSKFETVIKNPINHTSVNVLSYRQLFEIKEDKINGELEYKLFSLSKNPITLKKAHIVIDRSISFEDRHQITNQWGVHKLGRNFGYSDDLDLKIPQTLFFKVLSDEQKDVSIRNNDLHGKFQEILLIDDNGTNGWGKLLSLIHDLNVEVLEDFDSSMQMIEKDGFISKFGLIYLDLYLNKNKPGCKKESLELLKVLKNKFPCVPIIIFTASEKAINMKSVLDLGADGVYIKESPRYSSDSTFSSGNYNYFKELVNSVYEKYTVLTPYWHGIQRILNSAEFNTLENNHEKFQERIKERFMMFFGLLKKGYEQTPYDKEVFFYSENDLAFITLWSMFNEIQDALYQKDTICVMDNNNVAHSEHPSGQKFFKYKRWSLKSDLAKKLLDSNAAFGRFNQDGSPLDENGSFKLINKDAISPLYYSNTTPPYYFMNGNHPPKAEMISNRCESSISFSIAYILLNKGCLAQTLIDLFLLNEARNKLFLTHGSDQSQDYYCYSERDKRSSNTINPHDRIKDLMNLIGFIFTNDTQFAINI